MKFLINIYDSYLHIITISSWLVDLEGTIELGLPADQIGVQYDIEDKLIIYQHGGGVRRAKDTTYNHQLSTNYPNQ